MLYGDDYSSIRGKILNNLPEGLRKCYRRKLEAGDCKEVRQLWTLADMQEACKKYRKESAPGPSGITADPMLHLPEERLRLIIELCNLVIQTGVWPAAWKHGLVYPIPKAEQLPTW